jgi:hypothetical protein
MIPKPHERMELQKAGFVMDAHAMEKDPPAPAGPDPRDLELLAHLLVGLAYLGTDELRTRLRSIGRDVAADVEIYDLTVPDDESMAEMVSYLALGALLRGRRRLARRMRRGLVRSRRAASWALGTADRLTNNSLARPLRQPVERWLWATLMEGQQAIAEGRREAQTSRELAGRTVQEIVDDVVEAMIENPELMVSVQRLMRQQSAGLTDTLVGNTRQMTASADDLTEGVVRRLLRRGPRPAQYLNSAALDGEALPRRDHDGTADSP